MYPNSFLEAEAKQGRQATAKRKAEHCDVCDGVHTPIYHTYKLIKRSAPNEIIFVKLGDFYESFGDIELISRVCNVLARPLGTTGKRMIVGFPCASMEKYGKALALDGYTVRVFEQGDVTK